MRSWLITYFYIQNKIPNHTHLKQEAITHPTGENQRHTSPLQRVKSRIPDRRQPVDPTVFGVQQVLWSCGPLPDQMHLGQAPLTFFPGGEGLVVCFSAVVKPWCP